MREEGSNEVTIFRSSRYLYVGAGQMSFSQLQYFLIFFQIVCRDFPSIHTLARQQLPQSGNPSKFFSPNRDIAIGIYEHRGIAYLERFTVFSDTVSSVERSAAAVAEIWQYLPTSYGAHILPTERRCISLDKVIIIIITTINIVVVVVAGFSDSEPRLRILIYNRRGGYGDRFCLRPEFEMWRWQGRRRRLLLLLLRVIFSTGRRCDGKSFCRKSAIAFIRVLRVISALPTFYEIYPICRRGVAFRAVASSYSSSSTEEEDVKI